MPTPFNDPLYVRINLTHPSAEGTINNLAKSASDALPDNEPSINRNALGTVAWVKTTGRPVNVGGAITRVDADNEAALAEISMIGWYPVEVLP